MGANEPFDTSTLSKQLFSSMVVNLQCRQCQLHRPDLGCTPHRQTHHHWIISMPS
jgi:hypothetical protein